MTPEEKKQLVPRIVVAITRPEDEKNLEEIFAEQHVPIFYQCRGKGTAPSEMLDIFGLSGTLRIVTIGVLPRLQVHTLFEQMSHQIQVRQRGRGIAFSVPLTGLQNAILDVLNAETREVLEQKIKERIDRDMSETQQKSEFTIIWTSVVSGYSEDVMEAARTAGAKGGTILRGLRKNSEQASQFLGTPLHSEQEFVMIVTPKENKSAVMTAISDACGCRTDAHGIVFSLPVDEVMGLEQ